MFNFKTASVYTGFDLKIFNEIRTLLERADIAYRYQVKNRQGQFLGPGRGTVRSSFGSLGTDPENTYEYVIKVAPKDKAKASYVIRNR